MVKTGIKVVVRVRPTPDFAASAIQLAPDKQVAFRLLYPAQA